MPDWHLLQEPIRLGFDRRLAEERRSLCFCVSHNSPRVLTVVPQRQTAHRGHKPKAHMDTRTLRCLQEGAQAAKGPPVRAPLLPASCRTKSVRRHAGRRTASRSQVPGGHGCWTTWPEAWPCLHSDENDWRWRSLSGRVTPASVAYCTRANADCLWQQLHWLVANVLHYPERLHFSHRMAATWRPLLRSADAVTPAEPTGASTAISGVVTQRRAPLHVTITIALWVLVLDLLSRASGLGGCSLCRHGNGGVR